MAEVHHDIALPLATRIDGLRSWETTRPLIACRPHTLAFLLGSAVFSPERSDKSLAVHPRMTRTEAFKSMSQQAERGLVLLAHQATQAGQRSARA